MDRMMPMHRYVMMINRMADMREELSLSDDQASDLIDMQAAFKKEQAGYQAELSKAQIKLRSLMNKDASPAEIKKQLEACSAARVSMETAAYTTFQKMKSSLNTDQKKFLGDELGRSM